jgi:hypothetical protein
MICHGFSSYFGFCVTTVLIYASAMFDPSKLSPEAIAEITALMRQMKPEQMMRLQTLMHNSLAGFNVTQEMQAFEAELPAGFREGMARVLYLSQGIAVPPQPAVNEPTPSAQPPHNEEEARLVILRSVAGGILSPEEALKVLFP